MFKRLSIIPVVIILIATTLRAQSTYDFLRLDVNPRAAALAGTFTSNNDDANVIFYNPAGIGSLTETPVSFSYLDHLSDIKVVSAALSTEISGIGRMAAGIKYINYGSFERRDEYNKQNGTFGAGEMALVAGYSNILEKNFFYGANVKFIYSSLADVSSSAIALDLGLQYVMTEEQIVFGLSALNLGTQLSSYFEKKEKLPVEIRAGVSKRFAKTPIMLYLALNRLYDKQDSFTKRLGSINLGGEINLSKALTLRVGYDSDRRKDLKVGTTTGLAGFNIGLGLTIKKYNFDYAFNSLGLVGGMHSIGISTKL